MSAPYREDNLLDRVSRPATLELHYEQVRRREGEILARRLPLESGEVLSVGCGWDPGRHLFPAPAFRLTGVEPSPAVVQALIERGEVDHAVAASAGELPFPPASFDVVLYRLVLHHLAYRGELAPCFEEAGRLLRPGGALVAVEPGAWHPIGAALSAANRLGLGPLVHGTPDDIPLSPRRLEREAERAGLHPELHAVTFGWRRLPAALQRGIHRLDRRAAGRFRAFAHTLLLIARRPG